MVSSLESASIGAAAHLVNFMGTDTIAGILTLKEFYNAKEMPAFSIPASEHSSITSWGRDNEIGAYRNMIKQFGKSNALFACVSDSYDIMEACRMWGSMKQELIDSGAMLVVRPDSGHPETVVLEVVRELEKYFGATVNAKGYKVLNNVRVIQGDGINEVSIRGILMNLKFAGYSGDNVAFGMGGALLGQPHRDTQKFALKCSWAQINGEGVDVYKDPIGDATKKSKKGRLTLIKTASNDYLTIRESQLDSYIGATEIMQTVWENGKLLKDWSIEEIRERAKL